MSRGRDFSGAKDDVFNFDESLSVTTRQDGAGSGSTLYIIGGLVGLAVVAFIILGVFYQLKARKRY